MKTFYVKITLKILKTVLVYGLMLYSLKGTMKLFPIRTLAFTKDKSNW